MEYNKQKCVMCEELTSFEWNGIPYCAKHLMIEFESWLDACFKKVPE